MSSSLIGHDTSLADSVKFILLLSATIGGVVLPTFAFIADEEASVSDAISTSELFAAALAGALLSIDLRRNSEKVTAIFLKCKALSDMCKSKIVKHCQGLRERAFPCGFLISRYR